VTCLNCLMRATSLRLYHKIHPVSTTVTKFETQHKWTDGRERKKKLRVKKWMYKVRLWSEIWIRLQCRTDFVNHLDDFIWGRDSCVAGNEATKSKNDFLLHAGFSREQIAEEAMWWHSNTRGFKSQITLTMCCSWSINRLLKGAKCAVVEDITFSNLRVCITVVYRQAWRENKTYNEKNIRINKFICKDFTEISHLIA
jgi:hypothetical protein